MDQQIRLDLNQTQEVVCDACGGKTFTEGLLLRKVSGLAVGSAQTQYVPIPAFICSQCGHVNEEFLPEPLKKEAVAKAIPEKKEGKLISILSHDRP